MKYRVRATLVFDADDDAAARQGAQEWLLNTLGGQWTTVAGLPGVKVELHKLNDKAPPRPLKILPEEGGKDA